MPPVKKRHDRGTHDDDQGRLNKKTTGTRGWPLIFASIGKGSTLAVFAFLLNLLVQVGALRRFHGTDRSRAPGA